MEQLPLIVDDVFHYPRHLLHELEEIVKAKPEILESGGCYFAVGFIGHFASHICAVRLLWMPVPTQTFHIGAIETRGQFE